MIAAYAMAATISFSSSISRGEKPFFSFRKKMEIFAPSIQWSNSTIRWLIVMRSQIVVYNTNEQTLHNIRTHTFVPLTQSSHMCKQLSRLPPAYKYSATVHAIVKSISTLKMLSIILIVALAAGVQVSRLAGGCSCF